MNNDKFQVIYSQNREENQRNKKIRKKVEAREQRGGKDKMEGPI